MPLNQTDLAQFYGTENFTSLKGMAPLPMPFYATDGVRHVMEHGGGHGAFWLITAILSYQLDIFRKKDLRLRDMQFWKLTVRQSGERREATLTCVADSGEKPAVTQNIEYTDFDLPEIDIWVEAGSIDGEHEAMIVMLPSER